MITVYCRAVRPQQVAFLFDYYSKVMYYTACFFRNGVINVLNHVCENLTLL